MYEVSPGVWLDPAARIPYELEWMNRWISLKPVICGGTKYDDGTCSCYGGEYWANNGFQSSQHRSAGVWSDIMKASDDD